MGVNAVWACQLAARDAAACANMHGCGLFQVARAWAAITLTLVQRGHQLCCGVESRSLRSHLTMLRRLPDPAEGFPAHAAVLLLQRETRGWRLRSVRQTLAVVLRRMGANATAGTARVHRPQ